MPKCGGTSFTKPLSKLFNVTRDYHPSNRTTQAYETYVKNPIALGQLGPSDCLCGHYNIKGINLWERYPYLLDYRPRIFTVLRDPIQTAISGVRFAMQRGVINHDATYEFLCKAFLARSNYYQRVFGVKSSEDISRLKDLLWGAADIGDAHLLIQKINAASIKTHVSDQHTEPELAVPVANKTASSFVFNPSSDLIDEFREHAQLDLEIYQNLIDM